MRYYYVIVDNIDVDCSLYLIEANNKEDADKIFIKNFLPLLSDTECTDLMPVEDICNDFSFNLFVLSEEDIKILE